MKTRMAVCLCLALGLALLAAPQDRRLPIYQPERRMDAQVEAMTAPRPVVVTRRVDWAKCAGEAQELTRLAQAVQSEVSKAQQGLMAKDLPNNLKRLEKLAKQLRSDMTP